MTGLNEIVLIVGTGRSGTTLLAKILDSAPTVFYRHEPDRSKIETGIPFIPNAEEIEDFTEKATAYLRGLLHQRDARTCGSRPNFQKSFRSNFGNTAHNYISLGSKFTEKAGLRFNVPDFILPGKKPIYVIKSVDSLSRAELFLRAAPELRVLHIIRDPRAVVASRLRGIEQGLMPAELFTDHLYTSGLAEKYGFEREALKRKTWEEQAAFEWMAHNDYVFSNLADDSRYKLIHYEKLCTSPVEQARSVFEFSGVPWTSQTEVFLSQLVDNEHTTRRYFSLNRNLASALDSWKEELSTDSVDAIELMVSNSLVGRQFLDATSKV